MKNVNYSQRYRLFSILKGGALKNIFLLLLAGLISINVSAQHEHHPTTPQKPVAKH